jgi:hypothetical protein
MSTVDLGNCLGIVGGGCGSGSGTGPSSRHSRSIAPGRNTAGYASTMSTNADTTPMFTLVVDRNSGLGRSSDGLVHFEPDVIDLSSTLRLPRTPSPLFQKSAPDLRIQDPPQNQGRQLDLPRTPRKSFFSKLKKQLSWKTASDSSSNNDPPTLSIPPLHTISSSNSNNAHSDSSPTGLFKLHLSLVPLTPLSLSTSATPNTSRSPSPRLPLSYKREYAPPPQPLT